ncbi:4'-phosphopantetheinyl transferase family protein [Streptomyces sanyensis]|uniref:4'-phosphopantetheinyl transferase family protein n=1 Tax=Streptomyces sanyensis TaxID=568869 RepID=UPI003D782582
MIESLLPPGVHHAEAFADDEEPGRFPEETALVARAVPARRREFATVRRCARTALAELGVPPAPLLKGRRGEPLWPHGVVGSMTHCAGYRGAVVAAASGVASLGIDAEPAEPLPEGVLKLISVAEERERLAAEPSPAPGVPGDRLLFCAKEAVFKTWYPLMRQELDFHQASVRFHRTGEARGTFHAALLVPGPQVAGRRLDGLSGRWTARDGLLLTAVTLLADGTHPQGTSSGRGGAAAGSRAPAPL